MKENNNGNITYLGDESLLFIISFNSYNNWNNWKLHSQIKTYLHFLGEM